MTPGDEYRIAFETAPEAQLMLDLSGVVVAVSDGYVGATGWPRNAAVGRPLSELPPYDDAPASARLLLEALDIVRRAAIPVPNRMPDARVGRSGLRFDRGSSLPIVSPAGALSHIAHRLEYAPAPSPESGKDRRFRKLVEKNYDAILLADARGRVTFASPAIERITGYTPEEFLSRPPGVDLHPDDAARIGEDVRQVLSEPGKTMNTRARRMHRDGTYRTVDLTLINQLHDADVGALVVNVRDVTEQVLLEQNLRESQKLESLGVLAGGVAHDFNNLLATILGNASLMALEFEDNGKALASLAQVETAAHRAADLCQQMLAYAGKASLSRSHTQLDVLIQETTQLLRVSISKMVELRFSVRPNLPRISADPTQVQQVLVNLILNASDAIGSVPGVIEVRAEVVDVDRAFLRHSVLRPELPEGQYVSLSVKDSGPGIAPEARERIFEPFFSTKGIGRGLGLAAVLGIVRGHGGALRLHSEPGKGATFQLLFPVAAPDSSRREDAVESARTPLASGGAILLVEDEPALRAVQARMIGRFGLAVIEASNGREAVEIYRERAKDIAGVLMDMTMPHMGGVEAFRELMRIDPSVRVVLMSGYAKADEATSLLGLIGFMPKPFALHELERHLQALLDVKNTV